MQRQRVYPVCQTGESYRLIVAEILERGCGVRTGCWGFSRRGDAGRRVPCTFVSASTGNSQRSELVRTLVTSAG